MNIIERIDRPCEYVEVAQTALIACQYLYLWLFAGPDDAYKVYSLAILMAFEFVMVHSGLFMAAMPLKASIRLFIPLYGLFAFAFGHSMREGDYTIIILYLATVLNRMRFAFFNVSKSVKQRVVRQSMIALAVYFVLTVSVVCAESVIPSFSLGDAFSESASYTREADASRQMGKLADASSWYRRAYFLADSLNQHEAQNSILSGLGQVYNDLQNYQLAHEFTDTQGYIG